MPLPALPDDFLEKLNKGTYSTVLMNKFLKMHIKKTTGGLYPTREEYLVLEDQVCNALKLAGVVNSENYKVKTAYYTVSVLMMLLLKN